MYRYRAKAVAVTKITLFLISPSLYQLFSPLWQSAVEIGMEVQCCLHHALAHNTKLWLKHLAPCASLSQHWCIHSWSFGTSASRGMWKNWKDSAKAATMVQCLEWRCSEWEVEGAGLVSPGEGKPKAGRLEEQVQKGQTLLGHVRGLNKGQQAHVADGDVQLSLFHQMLQRGDGGSLLGGFLWLS